MLTNPALLGRALARAAATLTDSILSGLMCDLSCTLVATTCLQCESNGGMAERNASSIYIMADVVAAARLRAAT